MRQSSTSDRRLAIEPLETRRLLASGQLDPTFADGGLAFTDFGPNSEYTRSMALQDDGKIVIAGWTGTSPNYDFALARYNSDGTLDESFGTDGKVVTSIGDQHDVAYDVALGPEGKILVAGSTGSPTRPHFALVRYNSDGTLDTSFGGDGMVTTPMSAARDAITSIAVQTDGKIVAAGYAQRNGNLDFALVRYLPNGDLDASFSQDGKVWTALGSSHDGAYAVALAPGGKIVATGFSYDDNHTPHIAVARYRSNGSLDASFSGDGQAITPIGSGDSYSTAVAVTPQGAVVVVGDAVTAGGSEFVLVRYNAHGNLDLRFDDDGIVTTSFGDQYASASAVSLQANGKIVVVGRYDDDAAVARYHPRGRLDATFHRDGKATLDFGGVSESAWDVALASESQLLLLGGSNHGAGDMSVLARLDASAAPTVVLLSNSSVRENELGGTEIGEFSALDDDAGDSFTYSLVDPTVSYDNALFEIVGNELRTRFPLDYESRSSYSIRVRTTDSFGNFRDRIFEISVLDVQE